MCFRILCLILLIQYCYVYASTRQQLENSGKFLRNICISEIGVTEDQADSLEQGKFIEDRNVMCYVACVYSTGQVIKDNQIIHDAMIKQVDMMWPEEMKMPAKETVEKCRGVARTYEDICEASFFTAKCIYEEDPVNYYFP